MGFTRSTTVTNVHSTLGDYPAEDDHLTSEQLKERFDAPATGLKDDINRLEGELEATTSAASIGASTITSGDTSAANVQAKLNKLYADLQAAALGDIPDNSVTEVKLVSSYRNSLAKKDGNLQSSLNADQLDGYHASSFALKNGAIQTNLNAEKLGGSTKAQIISEITSRTSDTDGNYSSSALTTSTQTFSFSKTNVKTRFLLISWGFGTTTTPDYNDGTALFDCRNNKFIYSLFKRKVNTGTDYRFGLYGDFPELYYTYNGVVTASFTSASYASGTFSFSVEGKVVNSGDANAHKIYIKVISLDGLLP